MFIRPNLFTRLFYFLIPLLALYNADPAPAPPPAPAPAPTPDANTGVQALIDRHNKDLMQVINHLYNDNYALREKNRGLRDQVKGLEDKAPKEGAVVLTKAEAELLEAYKAIGEVAVLKTALGERDQYKGELGTLRKDGILRDVAEASGFKFSVLKALSENQALNGGDLEFEIREVEADGKKKPAAFVKIGDSAKTLADYAKEKWADFLPALATTPTTPTGTPYPNQNPGGSTPAPSVVSSFIERSQKARNSRPNPLVKQAGN